VSTNAYLPGMESEQRQPELSQWYTDPRLATKLWAWANRYRPAAYVLEPAAGRGALIKPIIVEPRECQAVEAVELDGRNAEVLEQLMWAGRRTRMLRSVLRGDFLAMRWARDELGCLPFDLALMNPPYEDGRAEAFILHALTVSERVCGIFKASILHGAERQRTLWSKCHTMREVRLMRRPSFGQGASGSEGGKTDFVVLEIHSGATTRERFVQTENWP